MCGVAKVRCQKWWTHLQDSPVSQRLEKGETDNLVLCEGNKIYLLALVKNILTGYIQLPYFSHLFTKTRVHKLQFALLFSMGGYIQNYFLAQSG